MPMWALKYVSDIYDRLYGNKNFYKRALVMIPTPEFIVLYNGPAKYPDMCVLKLSDAFRLPVNDPALELTVKVFNINKGHNTEIVQKSKALNDYVLFTGRIRENLACGMAQGEAINEGIKYCMENGILQDYLEVHGGEVVSILYTEFNMDDALEVAWEEGFERGVERGDKQGFERGYKIGFNRWKQEVVKKLKATSMLSSEQISEITGLSVDEIEKL
jgi:hypothetical protein